MAAAKMGKRTPKEKESLYDPMALHVLAYADGFTLWHYSSEVPVRAVAVPGFFNPARRLLRPGDRLVVNHRRGGRFLGACDFCVVSTGRPDVLVRTMSPEVAADGDGAGRGAASRTARSPAYA